jgi:rod shape-determining protein MreB
MKTKLPIHVAEDPLRAVVKGTGIAIKDVARYKAVLMN